MTLIQLIKSEYKTQFCPFIILMLSFTHQILKHYNTVVYIFLTEVSKDINKFFDNSDYLQVKKKATY